MVKRIFELCAGGKGPSQIARILKNENVERFLKIVRKYIDLQELTPEILREFIDRIEIHERSVRYGKNATQQIDIYYNFVGMLPEDKTENAQDAYRILCLA